ncbi:MAG: hypothetical protein AUH85_14495 [Chloroflexi bacterium 13_1_40CM_4_68_4]|nr:MAG: hypothetical protein AUH85_14495 [Chloroflexi bacterium 13_1_40CM_4_68_4]
MTALLERVAESWREFRGSVREDDLARVTSAGWRVRDLLAHVVGWEAETARRLAVFRHDGVQLEPLLPVDEFNSDSVSRYARLSATTLLDELDRTHRALVAEVGSLSDEQLRENGAWAAAIVAGNTFEHYAEHRQELPR